MTCQYLDRLLEFLLIMCWSGAYRMEHIHACISHPGTVLYEFVAASQSLLQPQLDDRIPHTNLFRLPSLACGSSSFPRGVYAAVWCTFQLNPAYSAKGTRTCLSASKFSKRPSWAGAISSISSRSLQCGLISICFLFSFSSAFCLFAPGNDGCRL